MIFMTLIYVIYLGYSDFHISFSAKVLELTNESVFILIQYNFVLLHELVSDWETREQLGNLIIFLTTLMLVGNLIVIIVESIRPFGR